MLEAADTSCGTSSLQWPLDVLRSDHADVRGGRAAVAPRAVARAGTGGRQDDQGVAGAPRGTHPRQKEVAGGAHRFPEEQADVIKNEIIKSINNLKSLTVEERRKLRNEKFLSMTSEI